MMLDHTYAVIMAGGEGSRLWPLSRQARPKQMVKLGSDRTLFQISVDRISGLIPPERIFVVTIADQAVELRKMVPSIPEENYLLETMPRGTASVVGLAAAALRDRDPQAVMAIITADHLIKNESYFHALLGDGFRLANDGFLVTLGIRPTFPATGYGYIQRGEALEGCDFLAYEVKRFKEKPDEETARSFLVSGDHDWNSGMFLWRVDRIWEEFAQLMPELFAQLEEIASAWGTSEREAVLARVWPAIQPQTIDYGIMEKARRVVVIPAADLGWNDVGSWESLFEVFEPDADGNILLDAEHIGLSTSDSLIVSDRSGRLIVTLGISGLVVVDTPDAVLVCTRENAQKVRDVVRRLKTDGDPRK